MTLFHYHGFRRPHFTSLPMHLIVRECSIAYAPEKNPLWVAAILDGQRCTRVIAAILRARSSPEKGKFRDMTNSNVYVLFATHDEHAVYTRKVDDVASSVARLRTLHAAHRRR
jgi:hypothetical protein